MKAYLIASCAFAAAAVVLAACDGPLFLAVGCIAFSLAAMMAHRIECGIAGEEEEFNRWKR